MIQGLTSLSIFISGNCRVTGVVYQSLSKSKSLKALICLSHKYKCFLTSIKKDLVTELTIVPDSHNSNQHYFEAKKARRVKKNGKNKNSHVVRLGCRGKVFYCDDTILSIICGVSLPEQFQSSESVTTLEERAAMLAAGF